MSISAESGAGDVVHRSLPSVPWSRIGLVTAVLTLIVLGLWEVYWRVGQQFVPDYRNTEGLWATVHRKLDRDLASTAIIGSSRVLFDINLETWERETGNVPYQLALVGTNPRPVLEHLALETDFSGLLFVGVTPALFFTPPEGGAMGGAIDYYRDQTPSQRIGQQISMLIEPHLGFLHFDTGLFTLLRRQVWWSERPNLTPQIPVVRRLEVMRRNRQTAMWHMLDESAERRAIATNIWMGFLNLPFELPPPDVAQRMLDDVMTSVRTHVEAIRARGGDVVFLRMPSTDAFRAAELGGFPRVVFWDRLLRETNAIGVHFEDYAALQDVRLPEWSHISSLDTPRFTADLIAIVRAAFDSAGVRRPELFP